MMAIGASLALVSLWWLGALGLAAAGVRGGRGSDLVVADLVAGAAILGCAGMAAIAAGSGISVLPFYGLVLVLAAVRLLGGRRLLPPVAADPLKDRIAAALVGASVVVMIGIAVVSMRDVLWWDGWAIWGLKARVLYIESTLPGPLLDPNGYYAFAHPDYPLAVPLVDWWLYRHAGMAAPALASFMGAIWFSLLPLLVWAGLRSRVDERIAAAAMLGTACFWPVAFHAIGGTADVVIAVALLGAAIELERAFSRRDRSALWRAGVYLSLGVAAKNEGLAIALIALVILGVAAVRRRRPVLAVPALLPLVAIAPWWWLRLSLGSATDLLALPASPLVAVDRVSRLVRALGTQLTDGVWLPLTLLAAVGAVLALSRRETGLCVVWALLCGYFALVCAVYVAAPYDLDWLLATSLPRVLGTFVPALVWVALLALQPSRGRTPRIAGAASGSSGQ